MAKKLIVAESVLKVMVGLGLVVLFAGTCLALSSNFDAPRLLQESEEEEGDQILGSDYGTFRFIVFLFVTALSGTSIYCCYKQLNPAPTRSPYMQFHPQCTCQLQQHPYNMQYVQPVQGVPMTETRQYVPPSQ